MDPIGENGLWFLLGLVLGAVASWLVFGWKRRPAATVASRAEPLGAVLERPNALASEMQPPEHQEAIASSRVIDVGAARAAGFNLKHADDLSILEGIGPKIEELLRANGNRQLRQGGLRQCRRSVRCPRTWWPELPPRQSGKLAATGDARDSESLEGIEADAKRIEWR